MSNMPLLESWNALAGHLMTRSSLSPRHRELFIMRVAGATGSHENSNPRSVPSSRQSRRI
jgi:hypothetical protein